MAKTLGFKVEILGKSEAVKQLQNIDLELAKLNKTQAALKKSLKTAVEFGLPEKEIKALSAELTNLNLKTSELKAKKADLNREIRNEIKAASNVKGSYNSLRAEVTRNTAQLRQMVVGVNATQQEYDQLAAKVKKGNIELSNFNRSIAASDELVGEYSRGIVNAFNKLGITEPLKNGLKALEGQQEKLLKETRGLTVEYNKLKAHGGQAFEEVKRKIIDNNNQLDKIQLEITQTKRQLQEMGKEGAGSLRKIGSSLQNTIGVFGIGLGATALLGKINSEFSESIELYDKQVKSVAKVEQAIKSTGGAARLSLQELTEEASKLQGNTIFGDEQILDEVTAQLLTFTNITSEQFLRTQKIALDVSTVLNKVGAGSADLKSVAIQLGKALNDPAKGLSALNRSGISFTKEQIEVIKQLQETNRLAEAQDMILGELERQYGGQAAAAVTGAGKIQQYNNAIGDLKEELGEKFLPIQLEITQAKLSFVQTIVKVASFINENKRLIIGLVAAFIAYKSAVLLSTIQTKGYIATTAIGRATVLAYATAKALLTGNIIRARAAMVLFTRTMAVNPFGAIAVGLITAISLLSQFARAATRVSSTQKELTDVSVKAKQAIVEEKNQLDRLIAVIKNENSTREEKERAVSKINAISPKYLGNITLENALTAEGAKIIDNYIAALERKAKAQAAQERLVELEKELIKVQTDHSESETTFWQKSWSLIKTGGNLVKASVEDYNQLLENKRRKEKEIEDQKIALTKIIKEQELAEAANSNAVEQGNIILNTRAAIEEKIKELREEQQDVEIGSARDKKITAEIAKYEALLKKAKDSSDKLIAQREKEAERIKKVREDLDRSLIQMEKDLHKQKLELIQDDKQRELEQLKYETAEKIGELVKQKQELINNETAKGDEKVKIAENIEEQIKLITEKAEKEKLRIRQQYASEERENRLKNIEADIAIELLKEEEAFNNRLRTAGLLGVEENRLTKEQLEEKERLQNEYENKVLQIRKDGLSAVKQLLLSELEQLTASLDGQVEENILSEDDKAAIQRRIQEISTELSGLPDRIIENSSEGKGIDLLAMLGLDEDGQRKLNEAIGFVTSALQGISDLQSLKSQERISEIEEQKNREIERIQNSGLLEEQKAKRIEQIEKEAAKRAEKERIEGAKKKQKIDIALAIINGAMAIIQSLANTTLPFPFSLAAPAAIGIATGVQIAKIKAQKFKKGGDLEVLEGGAVPKGGGIIKGRSHAAGGVKVLYKGIPMEWEGGEFYHPAGYIINKRSTTKFSKELHELLSRYNSYNGYGIPFSSRRIGYKMAEGGYFGKPLPSPSVAGVDMSEYLAAIDRKTDAINGRIDRIQVQINSRAISRAQSEDQKVLQPTVW